VVRGPQFDKRWSMPLDVTLPIKQNDSTEFLISKRRAIVIKAVNSVEISYMTSHNISRNIKWNHFLY